MGAARTAGESPELSKGRRPTTKEEPVRPVHDEVSPYLRRPLRSLEKAEQDCKHRQREEHCRQTKGSPVSKLSLLNRHQARSINAPMRPRTFKVWIGVEGVKVIFV
jgi:hypothetical protein